MFIDGTQGLFDRDHNVCIVGTGPVGIVIAIELARLGQSVTLLESGDLEKDKDAQLLSDALIVSPDRHAAMSMAVQRSFGGTSNLWGAGCVPLDPIDFEARESVPCSGWPIAYEEFAGLFASACHYAKCGGPDFEAAISGLDSEDRSFRTENIIRYSNAPRFGKTYRAELKSSERINVHFDSTVTQLAFVEDGRIGELFVKSRKGTSGSLRAKAVILACGGVETTRILLNAQADCPARFGGEEGPLGRYYMGHLSGEIADIQLRTDSVDKAFDFFRDRDGFYARRRLSASAELQKRERLTNISFWPILPRFKEAEHRSGILSLAYLALAYPPTGRLLVSELLRQINAGGPGAKLPHLLNVARDAPAVGLFLPKFLYGRFVSRTRLPGLHIRNRARRYRLHYYAEHLPDPLSRIRLTEERDALGMRKVAVDIRFSEQDATPIVRTHELLGSWLSATGLGKLEWRVPPSERLDSVLHQAGDGVHQIGTTRMAASERTGVVDRDCRVFGSRNLFLAGSAVFPTSGQANSTFSAIALGVRLANLVSGEVPRQSI